MFIHFFLIHSYVFRWVYMGQPSPRSHWVPLSSIWATLLSKWAVPGECSSIFLRISCFCFYIPGIPDSFLIQRWSLSASFPLLDLQYFGKSIWEWWLMLNLYRCSLQVVCFSGVLGPSEAHCAKHALSRECWLKMVPARHIWELLHNFAFSQRATVPRVKPGLIFP